MYPPGSRGGDNDDCGCTMGHFCPSHRAASLENDRHVRERMISKGINPDAEVTGSMLELVMKIELSDSLTQDQKDRMLAILHPVKK